MNFNLDFNSKAIFGKKVGQEAAERFKVSFVRLKKSKIVLCFFKNQFVMKKYPSSFLDERLSSELF